MSIRDEIREAMERLLSGAPQHTDGRLTRTNLALEAGVGRATVYRQADLMAEWVRRVAESDIDNLPLSAEGTIARLTRQLGEERRRNAELEKLTKGLAAVVAELYRQLDSRQQRDPVGMVTSIMINPRPGPARS